MALKMANKVSSFMSDAIIAGISQLRSKFNQHTVCQERLVGVLTVALMPSSTRNIAVIGLLPRCLIFLHWPGKQQPRVCDSKHLDSDKCNVFFFFRDIDDAGGSLFKSSDCCLRGSDKTTKTKRTKTLLQTKKSAIIHMFSPTNMREPQERGIWRTLTCYEQLHWHQLVRLGVQDRLQDIICVTEIMKRLIDKSAAPS